MRVLIKSFYIITVVVFTVVFTKPVLSQSIRSFDDIFPDISESIRETAFTDEGFFVSHTALSPEIIIGLSQSTIENRIINTVLSKQPGFLVESIQVVPGLQGRYSLLDVYNALGNTRKLQGRLYRSHRRNDEVPLFEEVTRLDNERRNNPINDPPPATSIPRSETIFMRLKDANFGNTFYRGDMVLENRGLHYTLTNNRTISLAFIPIIREERFTALLYFEPISEGVLIYALAGADVPGIANSLRIDMSSAISKRLAVIIGWVAEGITEN